MTEPASATTSAVAAGAGALFVALVGIAAYTGGLVVTRVQGRNLVAYSGSF